MHKGLQIPWLLASPMTLRLPGNRMSTTAVALFRNRELDTLALWETDPRLLLADDKDVALTRGELVVDSILDVDNVEATIVTLAVGDDTDTTHVTTTSNHDNGTSIEFDEFGNLSSGEIDLDGVVDLDQRVWVSDCSRIMRNEERDSLGSKLDPLDLAQLVLGLLGLNSVDGESALGIVDEAEVLARLVDGDDVHEAGGEVGIGANLAVNLDEALHNDRLDLATIERVLQSIAEEDDEW